MLLVTLAETMSEIRALEPGAATGIVLYNVADIPEDTGAGDSLRLSVERNVQSSPVDFLLNLQRYRDDEWVTFDGLTGSWTDRYYADEQVETAVAFLLMAADDEVSATQRHRKRMEAAASDAETLIRALKSGESYFESGRGPCLNGDSYIEIERGYGFIEWRIRVTRETHSERVLACSVESRTEIKDWEPCDFGMSVGNDYRPFVRYAVDEDVAKILEVLRLLMRIEEDNYDDPEFRREHGVTQEHLRTRTISEHSRATLVQEAA